ncbi:MAG: hypothetical protein IPO56_15105 [Flavobacteriales bacterium]|nr:hypothetical protein [Flavobacteriales bacterium]
MSALVSVREPGELRQYFERKRAEGKKPILWSMQCATSSCIACARSGTTGPTNGDR